MQNSEDIIPLAVDFNLNKDEDSISALEPDIISGTEDGAERLGFPYLEVYSLRFLRKDKDYEKYIWPHIFGVIAIQGSSGTSILFNRKVGDPRLVDPEGRVKLNGVKRCLKADSDIFIKPCLFGAKFLTCNKGPPGILWRATSAKSYYYYDKLLSTQVETIFGPLEVRYAVYKNANEAVLDLALADLVGDNINEFHGMVSVLTQDLGAISCIFQEENICVDLGKAESTGLSLPLCKHVVAVPCKSILVVCVEISRGNEIFANEKIELPARLFGEGWHNILCKDGTVAVKATWQNDGGDKVQELITGRESNSVQYQLCDWSSSRPLKVPRLTALTRSPLRPFCIKSDTHKLESYECSDMDRREMRLEVFSVRFVNYEQLDVGKMYGTFMIDVGSTKFVLYNRKVGDSPLIDSEGFVMLTAPRHGMVLSCDLLVFHYLFDLESIVKHGCEQWWSCTWPGGGFPIDQLLTRQMKSELGPIELTFAVYDPGAEARLEVKLVDCKVEGPVEISGHIKVKNNVVHDSRAVCSLFKGSVTCTSDDIISGFIVLPLLRRAVVVPLHSKMILDVCINIHGREIVSGELEFDAMKYGTKFEDMKDCYGNDKIRIMASWGYRYHDESLQYCW